MVSAIRRGAVSALVAISIGAVLSGEPSALPDFARMRDEAVQIASELPAAEWATIEVREFGPCFA